ncbi:MAG: hypothetical protein ACE5Q6_08750 [Dehalococcoidia bacterium]
MKINISKSGLGVRGIRVMLGIPGHRPSAHALCVGATLRNQSHPPAPLGSAGNRNVGWQQRFIQASRSCGQTVPKVQRTRKTPVSGGQVAA